jgi:hypothetical protein
MNDFILELVKGIAGPLIAGLAIWLLGQSAISQKSKSDAIRDLMTFRGDYSSPEFRRALNKVSITFHKNNSIREQIRLLYEAINSPNIGETNTNRKIVGLIYTLCQKNGFGNITEYDIDQSFPESNQVPKPESNQAPKAE